MWNFSFICRESKTDKKGLSAIELSVNINGERVYIALPLKVKPSEFKKMMSAKKNNEVLEYTSNVRTKLNKYINEMMSKDIPITAYTIKEYFKTGGTRSYTISQLVTEFLIYYKAKTSNCSSYVIRKYELALEKFVLFLKKDVEINTITPQTIEDFKIYLFSLNLEESTSNYILARVKTCITFAFNKGYLKTNPMSFIRITKKQKDVIKLDADELELIRTKPLVGRLANVRDLFLFQCSTGLAYADMANLVRGDIQYDESTNMHFIRKARQKTQIVFFTVLNEEAIRILEKYDYCLPLLSNQRYNSYLKEIQDLCNIGKTLHSHLARHTCATQLLNNGVPLEIVAKVLGHSNTSQTKHYAKLLDKTVLKALKNLV